MTPTQRTLAECRRIELTVLGRPQQRGSKKPFLIRGGTRKNGAPMIAMTDMNPKSRPWMDSVRAAAVAALPAGHEPIATPVQLTVTFFFARPKSHYGSGRNADKLKSSAPVLHSQQPDLDKLTRAIGDGLSGCVYRDDAQIYQLAVSKCWTTGMDRAEIVIETQEPVTVGECEA